MLRLPMPRLARQFNEEDRMSSVAGRVGMVLVSVVGLLVLAAAKEEPAQKDPPMFEAGADGKVEIFNGKDLTGWEVDPKYWRVENGEIVGQAKEKNNPYRYCVTTKSVGDFRLTFQVKLTPDAGNSGVQVRSVLNAVDKMTGPQADIGQGWWAKIYDEHGKALLVKTDFDKLVKKDDWNLYEVVAVGPKLKTALNGTACSDIDDKDLRKTGVIGFQLHAGGPQEVRFKEIKLELNPKGAELATVKK
jgi:hypothetical protein